MNIISSSIQAQVRDASPGKIVCEVKVGKADLNPVGALHGGFTAALVDNISTMALITTEGQNPGSSVDLNVT